MSFVPLDQKHRTSAIALSAFNSDFSRIAAFSVLTLWIMLLCVNASAQTVTVNYNSSPGSVPATGLGIGTAVYDGNLMDTAVPSLIKSAGYNIVRYPGGSYADIYHWQTNTATGGAFVNTSDTFDNFMTQVKAAGDTALITVNYGSNPAGNGGGDPNEAAAWVTYANKTKGYEIKFWEIGNEVYGNGFYGAQWEEDLHSDHSPTAYANNLKLYSSAMKTADSTIKVGAVMTTPNNWPDGVTPDWDSTILPIVCSSIDFVIMHWYPSTNQLFAPENEIPTISSTMRSRLNQLCPAQSANIQIWVTEGNWDGTQTPGALFAADQFLTWWEHGIASMDWQILHNGIFISGGVNQDSGVLSNASCSGTTCEPAADTPFPAYYGAQMVHNMAGPGDTLLATTSSSSTVNVHAAKNSSGRLAIMLINKDPSITQNVSVTVSGTTLGATGTKFFYGNSSSSVAQSALSGLANTFTVSLPPTSITDILTTGATANLVADGTYTFTNRNSSLVMDDTAHSTTAGTQMEQWASNGGTNQKWQLTNLGSNNVKLICVVSGLALDMSGSSKANGGAVIQWTPTGATNQIWHITAVAGGFFEVTNLNSGLALEVPGSSTTNGTLLDQSTYTGSTNQQWTIR
jgi:hypothetical protein